MAEAKNMTQRNGRNGVAGMLPTIISSTVILIALIGGFWSVADPRDSIRIINARFDNYVSQREHVEYKRFTQSERDALRRDLVKLEAQIVRVEGEQRLRTGTIERVASLEKDHAATHKQIEDLRKEFASLFPTTKVWDSMLSRIERLESEKLRNYQTGK